MGLERMIRAYMRMRMAGAAHARISANVVYNYIAGVVHRSSPRPHPPVQPAARIYIG